MHKSSVLLRMLCAFVMVVTVSAPPYAFSAVAEVPPPPKDPNVTTFTMSPSEPNSPVKSIETTVIEVGEQSDEQLELELVQATDGREITDVTSVVPDNSQIVSPGYFSSLKKLAAKFPRAVKNTAVVSTQRFNDWFINSRVNIIVFEVTLMSGMKLTELMLGPQQAALAPALTASLLIGSIIGYVEWHTPTLVKMYTNHNSFVKSVMTHLNSKAESPELSARLRGFHKIVHDVVIDKGYWFLKNASLNTFLYFIFKVILYASLKADGSIYERVVNGAQMINAVDVGFFFGLGFGATAFGMPTSTLIVRNKMRVLKEADGDEAKLARVDNLLTFWWSTALTLRAAAFSSLLVGYTIHWPGLMIGAAAAIGAMTGGSSLLNFLDKRKEAARKSCEILLEPELPGLFDDKAS